MATYGYAGQVLQVDLTSGDIVKEKLDPESIKDFIGGFGLNLRLATDLVRPMTDPLSSANPIIMGAGPLVGTWIPATSKLMALISSQPRAPLLRPAPG